MATIPAQKPLRAEGCTAETSPVRFHLSLNVSDLDKAVSFYRTLLGLGPAAHHADYAKFELTEPPLVLSLETSPHASGGALNHLGFRLKDADALVELQRRLEAAGIATTREDGVECCHSRQTKFWVHDPDRINWELYVLETDEPPGGPVHPGCGSQPHGEEGPTDAGRPSEASWEHSLEAEFPSTLPLEDAGIDRILLRGTFNVPLPPERRGRIIEEVRRVLRPGGRLSVHALVADESLSTTPSLPGPAAAVRHVPLAAEILEPLGSAGFSGLTIVKLSPSAVFRHEGVALRELLVEATKLEPSPFDLKQSVLYKGPLRQVSDDQDNIYPRGQRVAISASSAALLRDGPAADRFVFFPPGG